jgi:hypothetical protein
VAQYFELYAKKYMINSKREEDQKNEEKKTAFENGQSPESIKKKPNPRANENVKDKEDTDNKQTSGTGSEITDGEDG